MRTFLVLMEFFNGIGLCFLIGYLISLIFKIDQQQKKI